MNRPGYFARLLFFVRILRILRIFWEILEKSRNFSDFVATITIGAGIICCSQESNQNSVSSPSSEGPTSTGSAFFVDPVRGFVASSWWGTRLGGGQARAGSPTLHLLTGTQRKKSLTGLTVGWKSVKLLNWIPEAYVLALRLQLHSFLDLDF